MVVLAAAATWLQGLVEIGGKHPVEAVVIAIVAGVAIRNLGLLPSILEPGVRKFQTPLILGIVLYGSSLNFGALMAHCPGILTTVVVTMLFGFSVIYVVGRVFGLPWKLSILLSVGTTICGGSAIAVTSPLVEAREEETSYAVTTIALWGLVAILVYPGVARMVSGVTDQGFGVFAGTAIHSTPQVIGAGMLYSEAAGKVATAVKLVRNCFMIPLAFAISILYARSQARSGEAHERHVDIGKAFPWYLFGFFVMAILGTKGFLTPTGLAYFSAWGKFLILMGMAGIGLSTRLASFRGIGIRPFVVGLIGSVVVAGVSILLIWSLGLS